MSESIVESAGGLITDRLGAVGYTASFDGARRRVRLLRAHDHRAVAQACSCDTGTESLVQQQFKDECDVNTIVRRFGLSQVPVAAPGGVYGDFTGITDFESAVAAIDRARSGFEALPADVRERYGNDPGRFLRETASLSDEELDGVVPAPESPAPGATLDDVVAALNAREGVSGDNQGA